LKSKINDEKNKLELVLQITLLVKILKILVRILDQFESIHQLDTTAFVIMVIQAKELHVSTLMNVYSTRVI